MKQLRTIVGHELKPDGKRDFCLWKVGLDDKGLCDIAKPLEFTKHDPADVIEQPTFSLDGEACRRLMSQLWYAGIRPSPPAGNETAIDRARRILDQERRSTDLRPSRASTAPRPLSGR